MGVVWCHYFSFLVRGDTLLKTENESRKYPTRAFFSAVRYVAASRRHRQQITYTYNYNPMMSSCPHKPDGAPAHYVSLTD